MKNFVQPGEIISITAPYAVASGAFVAVGQLGGVAVTGAASGAPVEIATSGVYTLAKVAADVWAVGDVAYWHPTPRELRPTTIAGAVRVGLCVKAATAGSPVVSIRVDV